MMHDMMGGGMMMWGMGLLWLLALIVAGSERSSAHKIS
jgi:hypothetical protein